MLKVEKRLAEESERIQHYLDPSTEPKIVRVLELELIQGQVRLLVRSKGRGAACGEEGWRRGSKGGRGLQRTMPCWTCAAQSLHLAG